MANLLVVDNITLKRGGRTLLTDLQWQVNVGECWMILGQNGAGKSTLLRALAGLDPISAGQILLRDHPLSQLSKLTIAQAIAWLPQQQDCALPCSVIDYLFHAREPHSQFIRKIAEDDRLRIQHILFELNLTELQTKNIQQLSGGELQRVAIAAVLVQNPVLYLLDELHNHLDIKFQQQVLAYFKHQLVDRAVIATVQDLNIAERYATHVLLIFPDGRVLGDRAEKLLTTENLSAVFDCSLQRFDQGEEICWHPQRSLI